MTIPVKRGGHRVAFGAAFLLGVPSFLWCTATHLCRCGHLAHRDDPQSAGMFDLFFLACFVIAGCAAIRSDLSRRLVCCGLLATVLWSRLWLDSGGGAFLPIEIPAALYLVIRAAGALHSVRRDIRQISVHGNHGMA